MFIFVSVHLNTYTYNFYFRKHSRSLSKFLRKFLKQSSQSFSSVELPNTKYYVVGYGGPGANNEPHSFTMRGKISSSRRVSLNFVNQ